MWEELKKFDVAKKGGIWLRKVGVVKRGGYGQERWVWLREVGVTKKGGCG